MRFFLLFFLLGVCIAAESPPYAGYVFPAGGQCGGTFTVLIGGETIASATLARFSGEGIESEIIAVKEPTYLGPGGKKQKKRGQTVLDEEVTLRVTIRPEAKPGERDLCLVTPKGVTNKVRFQVGTLREVRETEPNNDPKSASTLPILPLTINGQILPGDQDVFRFSAQKGQHIIAAVSARRLIPYIADAVPGWFQATIAISDADGRELAHAEHFRSNQDPVLQVQIPASGEYRLSIRDVIYRGRQDFVYRIALGAIPYVTHSAPLGAQCARSPVSVRIFGWNLPAEEQTQQVDRRSPGQQFLSVSHDGITSNQIPFVVGTLPELDQIPSATNIDTPQELPFPSTVNGCIRRPSEVHFFTFAGTKDQSVQIEVLARRLGSPLDSFLILLDPKGQKIAENDEIKDKTEGLLTHQADSQITVKLLEEGVYTIKLFDVQGKGGNDYGYRLSVSEPRQDFVLQASPSKISVPQGGSANLTISAIRRAGFTGEIHLDLLAPNDSGLTLNGGCIAAGADRLQVTVSATRNAPLETVIPSLSASAVVAGKKVTHPVIFTDELMQAFLYQHMVPSCEAVVSVTPAAVFSAEAKGFLVFIPGKEVSLPIEVTRQPAFEGQVQLQLVDAPKGITLRRGGIPAGQKLGTVVVLLDKAAGLQAPGNLILRATLTVERPLNPLPSVTLAATQAAIKIPEISPKTASGAATKPEGKRVQRDRYPLILQAVPYTISATSPIPRHR